MSIVTPSVNFSAFKPSELNQQTLDAGMRINGLFCKLDEVIRKAANISEAAGFVEGVTSYLRSIFDAKIIYDTDANLEENPNFDFEAAASGQSSEPLMTAPDYPRDLLLGFNKFTGLNPKQKGEDESKGFFSYGTHLCAGLQGTAESLIKPGVARDELFVQMFDGLDRVYKLLMKYEKMEVQFDTATDGAGLVNFDQSIETANTEDLNLAQTGPGREVEIGDLVDTINSDGKALHGLVLRQIDDETILVSDIVGNGYHACKVEDSKILDSQSLNAQGLRSARMEFYDHILTSN